MYTQSTLTGVVYLGLWKGLSKQESLELGCELRQSGEISHTGRQIISDSWSNETERALTKRLQMIFLKAFSKAFRLMTEGCVIVLPGTPSAVTLPAFRSALKGWVEVAVGLIMIRRCDLSSQFLTSLIMIGWWSFRPVFDSTTSWTFLTVDLTSL